MYIPLPPFLFKVFQNAPFSTPSCLEKKILNKSTRKGISKMRAKKMPSLHQELAVLEEGNSLITNRIWQLGSQSDWFTLQK
jgi:hypothetical protein